ncbi:hypothetical protein M752DRAFT_287444 [Aspergillus phoenicis ATCC 13157]|uniref:Uncharacterized protein n=1 Tax=Aspergillus phoenicis ATCC 13157 TaxID=1353007 RepID=A0A370P558_ASPPH|nr:hypothetical protein M752DRAFT_287444 [Aspergillus phoenicis ATCC 13157]
MGFDMQQQIYRAYRMGLDSCNTQTLQADNSCPGHLHAIKHTPLAIKQGMLLCHVCGVVKHTRFSNILARLSGNQCIRNRKGYAPVTSPSLRPLPPILPCVRTESTLSVDNSIINSHPRTALFIPRAQSIPEPLELEERQLNSGEAEFPQIVSRSIRKVTPVTAGWKLTTLDFLIQNRMADGSVMRKSEIVHYPPARPRYSVSGSSSYLCPALALGLWAIDPSRLAVRPPFQSDSPPALRSTYHIFLRDLQGHPHTSEFSRCTKISGLTAAAQTGESDFSTFSPPYPDCIPSLRAIPRDCHCLLWYA